MCDILQAGSPSTMKSYMYILALQNITGPALPIQSSFAWLPTRLVTKHIPFPLCQYVPGMHSPFRIESTVDCFLCRWKRSQGDSGEGMKTTIKWEDSIEDLCFTPKWNWFCKFHHMLCIFIYCRSIWLDWGCVMCILKAGPFMGPNLATGKGIRLNTLCFWYIVNFPRAISSFH